MLFEKIYEIKNKVRAIYEKEAYDKLERLKKDGIIKTIDDHMEASNVLYNMLKDALIVVDEVVSEDFDPDNPKDMEKVQEKIFERRDAQKATYLGKLTKEQLDYLLQ